MSKEAISQAEQQEMMDRFLDEAKLFADARPVEVGKLPQWALYAEHTIRRLVKAFNEQPAQQEPALQPAGLRDAVYTVLEGFTLPHDVRKILETAYYRPASTPQPRAQQEPVAWANPNDLQSFDMKVRTNGGPLHTVPLYTSPQPAHPTPTKCWKCGDSDPAFTDVCQVPACGMRE